MANKNKFAVFGAGCFWGVESSFRAVEGVVDVAVGYAGGDVAKPSYRQVCTGKTGHAEVVQVEYDPARVTFAQLVEVFWQIHDPTTLNRQGPDFGTQYRSVIFYANEEQKHIAEAYISQLEQGKTFSHPIVTQVVPLTAFYPAEAYHQNYATLHPDNPYIAINDAPKVEHLRKEFPDLYRK
jgi:peptide-methionine (S)-S-oxide reductase